MAPLETSTPGEEWCASCEHDDMRIWCPRRGRSVGVAVAIWIALLFTMMLDV